MTRQHKQLLILDLSARLTCGVKILFDNGKCKEVRELGLDSLHDVMFGNASVKPYLRPISSMTEKEQEEYMDLIIPVDGEKAVIEEEKFIKVEDFYNQHLLDYRGLIPKGLALEALEGMYNIENI